MTHYQVKQHNHSVLRLQYCYVFRNFGLTTTATLKIRSLLFSTLSDSPNSSCNELWDCPVHQPHRPFCSEQSSAARQAFRRRAFAGAAAVTGWNSPHTWAVLVGDPDLAPQVPPSCMEAGSVQPPTIKHGHLFLGKCCSGGKMEVNPPANMESDLCGKQLCELSLSSSKSQAMVDSGS